MSNVRWVVAYFIPYKGIPSEETHTTLGAGWLSIGGSCRTAALPDSTFTTFSMRSSKTPMSTETRRERVLKVCVWVINRLILNESFRVWESLTGYGEGDVIAEYGSNVVRCDAVVYTGILPPRSLDAEVRIWNELVLEGHPVFEPFVLWLRIACGNNRISLNCVIYKLIFF